MLNSKSFLDVKSVAPYGKPKTKITSKNNNKRQVSIFNKLKSFIDKSIHSIRSTSVEESKKKDTNNSNSDRHELTNVASPIFVPGGFFKESNTKSILIPSPRSNNNDDNISNKEKNEHDSECENNDISMVNISNAKLADFFAQKGDEPLTEIEIEGVMSLLRKSSMSHLSNSNKNNMFNSTFNSPFQDKNNNGNNNYFYNNTNQIFNKSRILSTSSNFTGNNSVNDNDNDVGNTTIKELKVPQYVPDFDTPKPNTTILTANNPNSRISSISSNRSSVRRIFNYSGVRSPYRNTVIFKYPSNHRSLSTSNVNPQSQQIKSITKPSQTKKTKRPKLTNVASALVTLLENTSNSDGKNINQTRDEEKNDTLIISQESKNLANPYSSMVHKHTQQKQFINSEKKEDLKSETKQTNFEKPSTTIENNTPTTTTTSIANHNNNTNSSTVNFINTYKPTKSSSLSTNVVIADKVNNGNTKEPEEKIKDTKRTIIPQTSSFTFTFSNANDKNEDKKAFTSNEILSSSSSTPITPIFSTDKNSSNSTAAKFTILHPSKTEEEETGQTNVKVEENTNKYQYKFSTPAKSNIDVTTIDESKVDHFKSMFVF